MGKNFFYVTLALAVPFMAMAAEGVYFYDAELIPKSIESGLEIINLVLAVIAAIFAVKLAALSQGGSLEKTWNLMAIVALTFAVFEIYGALQGFMILHLGGLGDLLEFIFVLILAITFYKTRKSLLAKVLG